MIVYGYHIDLEDLDEDSVDELIKYGEWHGCYSVGRHQPTNGVFGKILSGDSCLFYPISVKSLTYQPTEKQKRELEEAWKGLSEKIRKVAQNKEPDVFIFDNSND